MLSWVFRDPGQLLRGNLRREDDVAMQVFFDDGEPPHDINGDAPWLLSAAR